MSVTTSNTATAFVKSVENLSNGARMIRLANVTMIADIVVAVRENAGERADTVLAVEHKAKDAEGEPRVVTYGDARKLAAGEMAKDDASALLDLIIGTGAKGRDMLADLASNGAEFARLSAKARKATLTFGEHADMNAAKEARDTLARDRNAVVSSLRRAIAAACSIVERAHLTAHGRDVLDTLAVKSGALIYTGAVKVADKGADKGKPVIGTLKFEPTRAAASFATDYKAWLAPVPTEPTAGEVSSDTPVADAGTTTTTTTAPETTDKREPHDNAAPVAKAIDAALADKAKAGAARQAILARVLSMVAASYGTEPDNAPKGEERDALLALHAAIGALFTPAQIAAFERKEAATAA